MIQFLLYRPVSDNLPEFLNKLSDGNMLVVKNIYKDVPVLTGCDYN